MTTTHPTRASKRRVERAEQSTRRVESYVALPAIVVGCGAVGGLLTRSMIGNAPFFALRDSGDSAVTVMLVLVGVTCFAHFLNHKLAAVTISGAGVAAGVALGSAVLVAGTYNIVTLLVALLLMFAVPVATVTALVVTRSLWLR